MYTVTIRNRLGEVYAINNFLEYDECVELGDKYIDLGYSVEIEYPNGRVEDL